MSEPSIPERLQAALADRYTIERELGTGGMATVYLAHDPRHNRKVAIKVLHPELAAIIGAERFLKEIEVTANLQHPHILPLFDSGEADGFLYYVMPCVEGESLQEKLAREKQLSIEESIEIADAVAKALDYAHRRDVIHRDIKPANILLHEGQPVVTDFGIALAVSAAGGRRLTETGLSLGTPEYMSPEQAAGERAIDARSDLYSLGCVVYEMLLGEPPHTGPTAQSIIAKVITDEPRRITKLRKTVPGHVEYAVHRALAKLPADRFATASEFAEALTDRSAAKTWPGFAAPAEDDAWTRFAVRQTWLRWAVPLSMAVLAVAAAWGWLRPTPAPRPTLARFEITLPAHESWSGRLNAIALSPDGSNIAYVSESAGGQGIFLRPIDQVEARLLPGTEGALDPFFSPDGQWVGFALVSGLKKVPVAGGPPMTIVEYPEPRGAVWGDDDVIIFGSMSGLWRVPAEGGDAERLTELNADRGELLHSRPELLPGGRTVLFTIGAGGPEETEVAALSLETSAVTHLFRGMAPRYSETGHVVYGRPDGVLMAVPFDPERLQVTGQQVSLVDNLMVRATETVEFAFSHNGTLLYQRATTAARTLVMVDRSGSEVPLIEGQANYASPRFSPDGTRLAIGVGVPPTRQIWIYEMAEGTMVPLTFEGHNYYPVWTPDGERVTFASETPNSVDLAWIRSDGSGASERLLANGRWNYPESWSPDGRHLLYREQDPNVQRDIWVLTLDGTSNPRPFFVLPSQEESPELSPDGRWLAYASDMSGRYEVYVSGFPEPGRRRQVSLDGGTEPVWSRDGSELFYRSGAALVAAAVETTPDFRVQRREVLFEGPYSAWRYHSHYDVLPDGQQFVMIKRVEDEAARLVVVLNWFEELRRVMEGAS
jgi:Tol biopolymer transport system component